jgi:sugar lactone lactonase YvrE
MNRSLKKRAAFVVAGLLVLTTAYLCWWPVPVEPVSWQAPPAPGYVGPHAANNRLADYTLVDLNGETGPEHILFSDDGRLYTGVNGGRILRMNADGSGQEVFVNTGGRVLGMDFDAADNLIVADAYKGLLSVDPAGNVSVLTTEAAGAAIGFADAVVVAENGLIYFSDASQRFPPSRWNEAGMTEHAADLDIFENSCTGRILEFDPQSRATRVVADGLSFANGVALSADEQSLFVAETGRYRIWRISVDCETMWMCGSKTRKRASCSITFPDFPTT